MPRDGSGVYTLPIGSGNPVAPGTTIVASWANASLNDISSALTDSLSRSGLGGMTAPFRLADGTIGSPGLAFTNEPTNGLYRDPAQPGSMIHTSLGSPNFAMGPTNISHQQFWALKEMIQRSTGFNSFIYQHTGALVALTPSTLVDGILPDYAKAATVNSATGVWNFALPPTSAGNPIITNQGGVFIGPITLAYAGSVQVKFDVAAGVGGSGFNVFQRVGLPRWAVGLNGDEGGANSGSDYIFEGFDDAGVSLGVFATLVRATGRMNFLNAPTVGADTVITTAGGTFTGGVTASTRLYGKTIIPANGTAIFAGGVLDWSTSSYNLQCPAGTAISDMTNESAGQIMRILVTTAGAMGAIANPSGGFTWAKGSPVWGVHRTIVTLYRYADSGAVVGMTIPIDVAPV